MSKSSRQIKHPSFFCPCAIKLLQHKATRWENKDGNAMEKEWRFNLREELVSLRWMPQVQFTSPADLLGKETLKKKTRDGMAQVKNLNCWVHYSQFGACIYCLVYFSFTDFSQEGFAEWKKNIYIVMGGWEPRTHNPVNLSWHRCGAESSCQSVSLCCNVGACYRTMTEKVVDESLFFKKS